jgi:hypothetical protein
MKKVTTILLLLINMTCIYAQGNLSKVQVEIRDLEEKERNAIFNHDTATLKKIWTADFTVNTPFDRVTTSSQELIEMVNKGTIRFSSFVRNIEKIVVKKNLVVTMGSEEVIFTGEAPKAGQTIKRRFTNIWMKQDGHWILSLRHANNICTD